MAKKHNGGYTAATGFKRTSASPLDDSDIVEVLNDLKTLDKCYPLQIVGVLATLTHYKWNGLDQTNLVNWVEVGATPDLTPYALKQLEKVYVGAFVDEALHKFTLTAEHFENFAFLKLLENAANINEFVLPEVGFNYRLYISIWHIGIADMTIKLSSPNLVNFYDNNSSSRQTSFSLFGGNTGTQKRLHYLVIHHQIIDGVKYVDFNYESNQIRE